VPSGMKLQIRPRPNTLHHRLVWQCASLLLSYPDQGRLSTVDEPLALRRRSTMYLTYWTAGDTRNRSSEMHAFAAVYRDAGVEPPRDEAPDYLPVVLRRCCSNARLPVWRRALLPT
jgi:nitrate reductase delta subunit